MQHTIETITAEQALRNACQNFIDGWPHFLLCINFGKSALDAEAISWMNEVPGQIQKALKKRKRE